MKNLTTEEFIEKARKVHGDKYDYSKVEYKTMHTKVCIICPIHGEFWQKPSNHISLKQGCPLCKKTKLKIDKVLTTEEFIEKARKIHGDKYDYSKVEYVNTSTKVCIICPIHGEFWQTPNNHINKCYPRNCPHCANTNRREHNISNKNEFIKKARKVHGDKYDYSKVEYINAHTKVCIICPQHGEFWQTPNAHLRGNSCPYCKIRSILEHKTINYLNKANIKYEKEKKFDWLIYNGNLRLDFYLPKYNIAIECQGRQHFIYDSMFYKSYDDFIGQLERDKTKFELCKKHNINVIYFKSKNTESKNCFYEDKTVITQIEEIKDLL